MKIAYLTSMYPDVSHTFIVREVRALRARGLEVATFSVRRPGAQNILGAEAQQEAASTRWLVPSPAGHLVSALAWCLTTRPVSTGRTLWQSVLKPGMAVGQRIKWLCYSAEAVLLADWLVKGGFEHLHCHFGNSGSSTGMLAARLAGIPFSMTCHGSELREIGRHRLTEKVAQAVFVACVSNYGKAQLMLACPPQHWHKLQVVRCGVSPGGESAKTRNDGPAHILCVGRLSPEKGHLVLLEALARLRRQGVDFRCTLVGNGPMRSTIEARIEELGLTRSLTLTGALEPDHVANLYQSGDVVVLASLSEGVPVVLMEAMVRGRPVVATRVGGVPELVEDGRSGLVVAPGDAEALAQALRRILDDAESAQVMARTGAEYVRERFSVDASADRLLELLNRVPRVRLKSDLAPECEQRSLSAAPGTPRLLIISPVRDEAAYLQKTIDSVAAQTVRPHLWIIVDDGSTDDTPNIVSRATVQHNWIRMYCRTDRGERQVGGGVIEAFYDGLKEVCLDDYEYLCKLDGDLELPTRYFARVLEHFVAEPALGTMSGKVYVRMSDGRLASERIGDDVSVGALKFYRVACFKDVGGFQRVSGWDGIDCHLCRLNGWLAYSADEPDLRVIHMRQMGSSQRGVWSGRKRWGWGKYYMGSHPVFVLAVCLYRMLERPWILGGLGIAAGYVGAMLTRQPRLEDAEYRMFLRRYEFQCLLRGKRKALGELHEAIRQRSRPS